MTLPNHYEMLGLTPAASEDEIARAFARQMSLFKAWPMAAAAQMSIAYETLRNPSKRRAYDASIGLPPPEPPRSPKAVQGHLHFVPLAPAIERSTLELAPAAPPPARPEPSAAEPRADAFIATSLREPPAPVESPSLGAPPIPEFPEVRSTPKPAPEEAGFAWKRPVTILTALVGGVGLIGAWAGLEAGSDAQQDQLTVSVPKAKDQQATSPVTAQPLTSVEAEAHRDAPIAFATLRTKRVQPARNVAAATDRLAEVDRSLEGQAVAEVDDAAAPAVAVQAAAASMPISNATIARTIGRIGYACGDVASTSAVEGASGVFTVNCTSGHSYQAKPVHGRYRFRRMN